MKDSEKLVPVLFSDTRFFQELETFSVRQTWIDLEDVSLRGIKSCLADRTKVFLSKEDGNEIFQATDDGLMLSTALNVVLGERSSGKTHTLNRLSAELGSVKYIKQFSLLQDDSAKFDELTSLRQGSVSETFLKEFKDTVDEVYKIDLKQNELDLDTYISTLLKHASEHDREDSYSRSALFSETSFVETNVDGLKKLIDAVSLIIENTENKNIVEKHLSIEALKALAVELIQKLRNVKEQNAKVKWLNGLISDVQSTLQSKSTITPPKDLDFYKILIEKRKAEKFSKLTSYLKIERQIYSEDVKGFKIVASARPFDNATHMKQKHKTRVSLVEAFDLYQQPYTFLSALKSIESISPTEYYRYFVCIEFKTLNKHGFQVSGGERAEFNLLHEIGDALQYDALLIDEPESSFDNIFLKNEVNAIEESCMEQQLKIEQIKAIRQKDAIPVLKSLGEWMTKEYTLLRPKTPIARAMAYSIKRWDKLSLHATTGNLHIDNNAIERCMRQVAVGRKNWLFCGSHDAAKRAGLLYSLLVTCKLNDVNPYEWLKDVLSRDIKEMHINKIKELLPHYWKKNRP